MVRKETSDLCRAVSRAALKISEASKSSIIHNSSSSHYNVYGEQVKVLDSLSNKILVEELENSPNIAGIASEELEEPILFTKNKKAKYVAVVDPLDGSSNIDYMITVGTIFGFYEIQRSQASKEDFLQPGNKLILAGYTLYGPATNMVISDGAAVTECLLKKDNFYRYRENIKCPEQGKWLSVNGCNFHKWEEHDQQWFLSCLNKGYSQRYVGSLVADFHRTLLDGGIFSYPADKNDKAKLRLLYECNPLAFIMNTAGGKSISGPGNLNILDITPNGLHNKMGFVTGSVKDIEFYNGK